MIASATGSTGYALSAGGPPIDPRVRAITVVPLAPHAVITRPIVLPEATVVEVAVLHGRAFVAADGQHQGRLAEGGRVSSARSRAHRDPLRRLPVLPPPAPRQGSFRASAEAPDRDQALQERP